MHEQRRWRWIGAAMAAIVPLAAVTGSPASASDEEPVKEPKPDEVVAAAPVEEDVEWFIGRDLGGFGVVARTIGAPAMWASGKESSTTGRGIGVAVIDTGMVPVDGLDDPGKVINGPDLSFESQSPQLDHLDSYGHGTHMSGIIAGNTSFDDADDDEDDARGFRYRGIAPDAHLVNVKVGADDGAVDVSQVIAAIDWVVEHKDDPGLNIRVLNLSFGTDSAQTYKLDPLAYAVENAWRHGIVVVVAGGNDGALGTRLNMPAIDPFVIAVGAADTKGTDGPADDSVAPYSSVGSSARRVDLVAPGKSIVSLRAPGSNVDTEYPDARLGTHLFRGSGSSQAAAVTSGAVALLLDRWPELTPDQVKSLLVQNATRIAGGPAQGAGELQLRYIGRFAKLTTPQTFAPATGLGSLEASRGSSHVVDPADLQRPRRELTGEIDIFGRRWDAAHWVHHVEEDNAWHEGKWRDYPWSGKGWTGTSWTERTWASTKWSGYSWIGVTWTGRSWTKNTWDGRSWTGRSWTGRSWTGRSWTGRSWTSG